MEVIFQYNVTFENLLASLTSCRYSEVSVLKHMILTLRLRRHLRILALIKFCCFLMNIKPNLPSVTPLTAATQADVFPAMEGGSSCSI